jgi:hypothetical protein
MKRGLQGQSPEESNRRHPHAVGDSMDERLASRVALLVALLIG